MAKKRKRRRRPQWDLGGAMEGGDITNPTPGTEGVEVGGSIDIGRGDVRSFDVPRGRETIEDIIRGAAREEEIWTAAREHIFPQERRRREEQEARALQEFGRQLAAAERVLGLTPRGDLRSRADRFARAMSTPQARASFAGALSRENARARRSGLPGSFGAETDPGRSRPGSRAQSGDQGTAVTAALANAIAASRPQARRTARVRLRNLSRREQQAWRESAARVRATRGDREVTVREAKRSFVQKRRAVKLEDRLEQDAKRIAKDAAKLQRREGRLAGGVKLKDISANEARAWKASRRRERLRDQPEPDRVQAKREFIQKRRETKLDRAYVKLARGKDIGDPGDLRRQAAERRDRKIQKAAREIEALGRREKAAWQASTKRQKAVERGANLEKVKRVFAAERRNAARQVEKPAGKVRLGLISERERQAWKASDRRTSLRGASRDATLQAKKRFIAKQRRRARRR